MDNRAAILDAAERRTRLGGYGGFSFRDVAQDVGIKSSSVHYHFPTKQALGQALADRYVERLRDVLGDPSAHSSRTALRSVVQLFITANETDDLMCLCGILGAESDLVPREISVRIAEYFSELTSWLENVFDGDDAKARAQLVIASLEGGMIMSRSSNDPSILRDIANQLEKAILTDKV